MNEQWKDISGYEGLYQVSNKGNVRKTSTKRLRALVKHPKGYLTIQLSKHDKKTRFNVHRLVATAFLGMPSNSNLTQCHHQNCIRNDNRVSNLQWVSGQYNMLNRKRNIHDYMI